jgi:hypothetical protein
MGSEKVWPRGTGWAAVFRNIRHEAKVMVLSFLE